LPRRSVAAKTAPAVTAPRVRNALSSSRRSSPFFDQNGWRMMVLVTPMAASVAAATRGALPIASSSPAATDAPPITRTWVVREAGTPGTFSAALSRTASYGSARAACFSGYRRASMPSTTKTDASRGRASARTGSMLHCYRRSGRGANSGAPAAWQDDHGPGGPNQPRRAPPSGGGTVTEPATARSAVGMDRRRPRLCPDDEYADCPQLRPHASLRHGVRARLLHRSGVVAGISDPPAVGRTDRTDRHAH